MRWFEILKGLALNLRRRERKKRKRKNDPWYLTNGIFGTNVAPSQWAGRQKQKK